MKHIKKLILEEVNIEKLGSNLPNNTVNKNLIQEGTIIIFDNGNGVMRGIVAEIAPEDNPFAYSDDTHKEYYEYELVVYVNENEMDYPFTTADIKGNNIPSNLEEYHVSYSDIIKIESDSKPEFINRFFKKVKNNSSDLEVLAELIKTNFKPNDVERIFNGDVFVSRDFIICLFKYLKSIHKVSFK